MLIDIKQIKGSLLNRHKSTNMMLIFEKWKKIETFHSSLTKDFIYFDQYDCDCLIRTWVYFYHNVVTYNSFINNKLVWYLLSYKLITV